MTITLHPHLSKDWSLRNEILARVQKEAWVAWAERKTTVALPKYEKVEKVPRGGVIHGLLASILI